MHGHIELDNLSAKQMKKKRQKNEKEREKMLEVMNGMRRSTSIKRLRSAKITGAIRLMNDGIGGNSFFSQLEEIGVTHHLRTRRKADISQLMDSRTTLSKPREQLLSTLNMIQYAGQRDVCLGSSLCDNQWSCGHGSATTDATFLLSQLQYYVECVYLIPSFDWVECRI